MIVSNKFDTHLPPSKNIKFSRYRHKTHTTLASLANYIYTITETTGHKQNCTHTHIANNILTGKKTVRSLFSWSPCRLAKPLRSLGMADVFGSSDADRASDLSEWRELGEGVSNLTTLGHTMVRVGEGEGEWQGKGRCFCGSACVCGGWWDTT